MRPHQVTSLRGMWQQSLQDDRMTQAPRHHHLPPMPPHILKGCDGNHCSLHCVGTTHVQKAVMVVVVSNAAPVVQTKVSTAFHWAAAHWAV